MFCAASCCARNPVWCGLMMLCMFAKCERRLFMIFSRSFPSVDVRVIGLYDVTSVGSLFGLGMTVIVDVLKAVGKWVWSRMAL